MNRSVFYNELRLSRGMVIGWTCAIVALALVYMSVFPAFSQDAAAVRSVLGHMPPAVRSAFKIDIETMLSFLGFYSFTFTLLTLLGGFAAVGLGLGIFSREERSKTTDFLLSKPVKRREVFFAKISAGLLLLLLMVGVFTIAEYGFIHWFDVGAYDTDRFLRLQFVYLLIVVWLYGFGVVVSQLVRIRSVIAATLGIVFSFFVVGIVGAIVGDETFRYISPFKAIDVMQVAAGAQLDLGYAWLLAAVFGAGLVYAYYVYTRREVRASS